MKSKFLALTSGIFSLSFSSMLFAGPCEVQLNKDLATCNNSASLCNETCESTPYGDDHCGNTINDQQSCNDLCGNGHGQCISNAGDSYLDCLND